jgi:hypothetical protein
VDGRRDRHVERHGKTEAARCTGDERQSFVEVKNSRACVHRRKKTHCCGLSIGRDQPVVTRIWLSFATATLVAYYTAGSARAGAERRVIPRFSRPASLRSCAR